MKKTILLAALLCAGCNKVQVAAPNTLYAELANDQGEVIGGVSFIEAEKGVNLHVELRDVTPGEHGIHIHNVGKCERPTFESAGPHYNPAGNEHGIDNPHGPHAGDLPNITVDDKGKADFEFTATSFTLKEITGRSIVLHEFPDDYKTDPAGNSGARIACGVIK